MNPKTLCILAGLFSFALACNKTDGGGDTPSAKAPVLLSTTPASGTKDLAPGETSVVLEFDQNVKCTSSKVTLTPKGSVDLVNAVDKKVTVKITLPSFGTEYTLTFPAGCISGFQSNPTDKAVSISLTTMAEPTPIDPDVIPEREDNVAWNFASRIALGFNLGNQMDAYLTEKGVCTADETCWGNPKATAQTFQKIKACGFSTARIPITWMGHIGAAPDYKIDAAWLDRVAEIVGYAESAGLFCIINTHHDEYNAESASHWLDIKAALSSEQANKDIQAQIKAVWGQIAEKFKDKGDWLMFESFNEIQDGGWGWSDAFRKNPQPQYDILNTWNQVFVDAVRATGGNNANRWLGVPGYAANTTFTMEGLVLPKDSAKDRIAVAVHCYDPAAFCGAGSEVNYEEWGHTGADGKKPSEGERDLRLTMATLYNKYIKNNIPCYLGECGCSNKSTTRGVLFQKYYLEYFSKAARSFGMGCIIWDNGVETTGKESFGYLNHGTGEYIANGGSVIPAMAKGQNDTSPTYTLDSVYANAPK